METSNESNEMVKFLGYKYVVEYNIREALLWVKLRFKIFTIIPLAGHVGQKE